MTASAVIAALRDATLFLVHSPDVAEVASVIVTPDGSVNIQLDAHQGIDDATRGGLLYGLAAIYGGDLRSSNGWVFLDMRWRERSIHLSSAARELSPTVAAAAGEA